MERFKNSKVVVTGGAGFIGSHLVQRLLDLGAEVTVIDNLLHGDKIEHLPRPENLFIYEADVRDTEILPRILRDKDIIFHLAAVLGVEEAQLNPFEVLDVEIQGTVNVLNLAVNNGIKRVIFASSSEVYGDSEDPMKEEAALSPRSTYAVAKLAGEEYCRAFCQKYGMEYAILRYFNVYGPRQDERFVISRFVTMALSNQPMLIYGDGRQGRDFTYIDDAVDMSLLAAIQPKARFQTINIGTGMMTAINEVADLITQALDKRYRVKRVHIDYDEKRSRRVEVFTRVADTTRIRELLHYEHKVSLESGIRKYVDWRLVRGHVSAG